MKTIVLGDTHGKSFWKMIAHLENPDRIVFVGDYFDSFEITTVEQIHNFKEIVEYKETSGKEVIMLVGNHDLHYFPEAKDKFTSGYQAAGAFNITPVLHENRHHLQACYRMGKFLFTHAGVSPIWMDSIFDEWSVDTLESDINSLFEENLQAFEFNGVESSGDDLYQTPMWIRPRSLMKSNKKDDRIKRDLIQVVGHTRMRQLDIEGKHTGGKYYFVDVLDSRVEYLIIEDDQIKLGKQ